MSTGARRSVGGGRHFPVGRRLHVPVVDTGCGCRPSRPRLLSLPSFLKPSLSKPVPARSASHLSSSSFPSSSSTASFSSSSSATNCSSSYSSSSNYYNNYYYSHGYSAATKQQQDPHTKEPAPARATKRQLSTKKKRYVEKAAAAAEEGVGVAVEKESSDPLADFRESMVQMAMEMGLCDWDDLRCMLRRLLALNAPRHHAAILTAFAEVCAQLAAPPAPPPPSYHQHRR